MLTLEVVAVDPGNEQGDGIYGGAGGSGIVLIAYPT